MPKLEVEKICRLCGEEKSRMRSLFEQRREYPLSLHQIISDVSRLEVEPDDGMPQKICKLCTSNLLKIYESVERFRENDRKLRRQLGETLYIEIKQEEPEMEVEMLEEALTHDLTVDEICVKKELEELGFLTTESNDQSELVETVLQESVVLHPDGEDDWAPEEDNVVDSDMKDDAPKDNQNEGPPQKKPRRRNPKAEKEVKVKRKGGRPRTRKVIDRPRLHDHKCYICKSESHGSAEALIAHLNSNHRDLVPYTCPLCIMDTVVIRFVEGLNVHMRQHENPEKCPHCDKRLADKRSLATHMQLLHTENEAPPTCKYCGKVCPSKASLIHHMKVHTTAASCEICGRVFKERHKLRLHIERKHEKQKKHECTVCKKKLGSLDSLQNHVKIYHSNQEFKCSYCPKTFGRENSLLQHEKKHINNPDFVSCKDWTEYYTVIEGQEDKPSGARLKKCNICGRVTSSMFFHLTSTHFPTDYHCETCGETFKRKSYYDAHVLEHKYGKAHQCPICGREFTLRRNLISHLRTKKHQDHPLAQSLDWLNISAAKSKPRKKVEPNKDEDVDDDDDDDSAQQQEIDDDQELKVAVDSL